MCERRRVLVVEDTAALRELLRDALTEEGYAVHTAGDGTPGVAERAARSYRRRVREPVRRWEERHHYFGGVSSLGKTGAAADPRRSGATRTPTSG